MQHIYPSVKDKVEFVAVSLDSDADDAIRFTEENGIEFPVLLDPKAQVASLFGVDVIPLNFVLDRSGRVTAVQEGYPGNEWLVREFEKILGEPLEIKTTTEPEANTRSLKGWTIFLSAIAVLLGIGIFFVFRFRARR